MLRFLYGAELPKAIKRCAKKAKTTKAAVAYVTEPAALGLKSGDLLVMDATDKAIATGQTSAKALERLHQKNVILYSHPGLHAKVVLTGSTLFVSSSNLSKSSETRLLEAGIETDSPTAVAGATVLFDSLARKSTKITEPFLKRIKKIKVQRTQPGPRSKLRDSEKGRHEAATWLLGTHDIEDPPEGSDEALRVARDEQEAKKHSSDYRSNISWIRYARNSRVREIARGDTIIVVWRSKSHGMPQAVYRHMPVLLVTNEPNCIRIYYEELRHSEKTSLSWPKFLRLAKLACLRGTISKNTIRKLEDHISNSLNNRWDEF